MYRIKCFLGSDLGWLYIVDSNQQARLYSLEEAKEFVKQYELFSNKFYLIVDENGGEILE